MTWRTQKGQENGNRIFKKITPFTISFRSRQRNALGRARRRISARCVPEASLPLSPLVSGIGQQAIVALHERFLKANRRY
jgi:hypothetical protein